MYRMAEAGAKYQHTINQVAIVSNGMFKRQDLKKTVDAIVPEFTRTPQEIAEVMFENVKAGVGKGINEITRYQVAVASATDESLSGPEGVGAKLLGIMNAYGMTSKDFPRIANAVTAGANATAASVYSIGESMEYTAGTAHMVGMSIEQTIAIIGKLSQASIKGSAAGTAINNMLLQLVKSSGEFSGPKKKAVFAKLGVDPAKVMEMINAGQPMQALEYIDAASRKQPVGNRLNLIAEVFNMRGMRGMVEAFMGGQKSLKDIREEIEKGIHGDIAMKQAKAMTNDLYGDMKHLASAFDQFKNSFAEAVGPTLRVILTGMTKAVQFMGYIINTPVGKVFAGLVAVLVPMIAIMFAFRAALLTATIALRGFGTAGAIGGFGGLLRGGMGMAGSARIGGALAGGMARNAAGRWTVAAGQTISHAGKIYKGGQLLPAAYVASMGMAGAGAAGVGSKLTSFLGAAGPWVSKGLSFMGRMLPIVGTVWGIYELTKGILHFTSKKEEKEDPFTQEYNRVLRTMYFDQIKPGMSEQWLNNGGAMKRGDKETMINQRIEVNMDGMNVMNQQLQNVMKAQEIKDFNSKFNFEMPEIT